MLTFFHDLPLESILCLYAAVRLMSLYAARDMLKTVLCSATGKKYRAYIGNATLFQRLYCTHVPRITGYQHGLSKYLAANNVISAALTGMIVVLAAVSSFSPSWIRHALKFAALLATLILCIPPFVLSYLLTSYNGGHPHYWFDLQADFIGRKAQYRRRRLLSEKKKSILMTPDEFAGYNNNKKPASPPH